jgi:predicted RNase H-like nuclease (RuvC/YqgF family)
MSFNHIETKNRLLTEALNKRNEDIKALENGNEDLINLLEKCDDKIQKLDEDYRVEQIRAEKYEAMVEGDKKIDIESLDGRINFLVNTLEEYRRILEDDSEFQQEGEGDR